MISHLIFSLIPTLLDGKLAFYLQVWSSTRSVVGVFNLGPPNCKSSALTSGGSRPSDKGGGGGRGGGGLQKNFSGPFASVWSNNKGRRARPPPGASPRSATANRSSTAFSLHSYLCLLHWDCYSCSMEDPGQTQWKIQQ